MELLSVTSWEWVVRGCLSEDRRRVSRSRMLTPGRGTSSAKVQQEVQAWPVEGTVRRLVRLKSHGKESRVTTRGWHGGWSLGHREVYKPALKGWLVFWGMESHCWVFAGEWYDLIFLFMKLPRGEWTVKGKRRCKEGADMGSDDRETCFEGGANRA